MNLEIKKENNSIIGNLNLDFYNLNVINACIKEFQEICEISIKNKDNEIELTLTSKSEELNSKEVFLEFCNYVLANMKNKSII